jgi:hypothetical protein
MLTLHVTNGDSAAQGLARSGLTGDVLAWRDILHDGPVPTDDGGATFWDVRARFLTERRWGAEEDVAVDLASRDERLAGLTPDDAIVLWFEPDLYDQLQLIQILNRVARIPAAERPPVSIAPADLMLGTLAPDKFRPLFVSRRSVTDEDFALGRVAWDAFTATTPDPLTELVDQLDRRRSARTYAADESVRLPHLTQALRRMLEEYPDIETGLSRSERQICEALTPGPTTLAKLYPAAHHASESWTWLGDWSFAWYVERLGGGTRPLIEHTNGTRIIAPAVAAEARNFWERSAQLTSFGLDVVRARANAVTANGIDRWIGGVHLTSDRHWWWDGRAQRVVAAIR